MRGNSIVALWALVIFMAGTTMVLISVINNTTTNLQEQAKTAAEVSPTLGQLHEQDGLSSNYRRGVNSRLEVSMDGTWHQIRCSMEGWQQQGLYFRHNLPAVAEGCELIPSENQ